MAPLHMRNKNFSSNRCPVTLMQRIKTRFNRWKRVYVKQTLILCNSCFNSFSCRWTPIVGEKATARCWTKQILNPMRPLERTMLGVPASALWVIPCARSPGVRGTHWAWFQDLQVPWCRLRWRFCQGAGSFTIWLGGNYIDYGYLCIYIICLSNYIYIYIPC